MTIRETVKAETITAMKAKDKDRTAALRLIAAKIKDRDIELRTSSKEVDDDLLVTEVLQKMGKQRKESIAMYRDGGREELAAKEEAELGVIEEFLPKQMDDAATAAAIEAIKADIGASSIKDMGKVMAELKSRHGAELDMAKASAMVKGSFA